MTDDEIIKRRFPDEALPEWLTYGFDEDSFNDRKTYVGVVFDHDAPVWKSGTFYAVDEAEPPERQPRETMTAFAERVRKADEARSGMNQIEDIYPAALAEQCLYAARRYWSQVQARDAEHQHAQTQDAQQRERDERDIEVYFAYERGKRLARERGISV